MKTRIRYSLSILLLATTIAAFSHKEQIHLPTVISINTPGKFDKELLLNLRASFGNRKIKTINMEEALELQKDEMERVMKPYYENLKQSANRPGLDEIKVYMSLNLHKVCNSLTIDISTTDDGIINDTIKWSSLTLPFDFLDIKRDLHVLILDPKSKTSILNITQAITDSIIASNVLVKQ